LVVIIGGSQGSAFLNRTLPEAAKLSKQEPRWIHAVGLANYEAMSRVMLPAKYEIKSFLEAAELAEAYSNAAVAVGRSGGTLAEYALFRLPSVLVPLPTSADDHQLHNAKEFVEMGAATLLTELNANPSAVASAIDEWLSRSERRDRAANALAAWDLPNATSTLTDFVMSAAL
jgi:UDP-N-acetylglucosamine--N-acetylmuramyl-(pentapeptide) pyrophosphoryl-undecaprenol N-acetylglucosamine transferase